MDCGRFGDIPFRKENCKSHPGYCPPPPMELPAVIGEYWTTGPPQPPAGLAMSSHGALVDATLAIENATNCQASPSRALLRRSLVNLGVRREVNVSNLTPGFIVEWTSAASAGTRAIVPDELYPPTTPKRQQRRRCPPPMAGIHHLSPRPPTLGTVVRIVRSDDTKQYSISEFIMTTTSGRRRWRGPRRPLLIIAAAATIVIAAASASPAAAAASFVPAACARGAPPARPTPSPPSPPPPLDIVLLTPTM